MPANRPLRLLMVGPLPPNPGGGSISRAQLLSGFTQAGHFVAAAAPITAGALEHGDRFAARHPEMHIVRYLVPEFHVASHQRETGEFEKAERGSLESILPVLVESSRPDLLIAGREGYAGYVLDLARTHRLPWALFVRGNPTVQILQGHYRGHRANELLDQCRQADLVLTVAEHLTEGLKRTGCTHAETIPNAIDLAAFSPEPKSKALMRELAIGRTELVALAPGVFHARKRPLDVVRSAQEVLKACPNLIYVMPGVGPLRAQVEEACEQARISSKFRFPGWVGYDRMPDFINLADVVIMASEAEGLSRVYLEAMACERLLIATDIPPAREIVKDGVNGLLFRLGDTHDLAAKTLRMLRDPSARLRLGRKARESMQIRSIDRAVEQYLVKFAELTRFSQCAFSARTPCGRKEPTHVVVGRHGS